MTYHPVHYPPACDAGSLIGMDNFHEGLAVCARDLLATHIELMRECRYIADLQRWLLSQIAAAIAFDHIRDPALPPLTAATLVSTLAGSKIASRNTIKSYLKEMVHYGFGVPLETADRRCRAVQPTDTSKYLIWRYLDIHLRALDIIDGGQRTALMVEYPDLLFDVHPRFARAILAQEAWYEPPKSIAKFTLSNSGSSILHEIAAKAPEKLPEAGTKIWVGRILPDALAKSYGISRTHASYLFGSARQEGFIGWENQGSHDDCWISSDLVADYRSWQALKLATIARAFHDACQHREIKDSALIPLSA